MYVYIQELDSIYKVIFKGLYSLSVEDDEIYMSITFKEPVSTYKNIMFLD